ncbi:hypothetical protein BKE30_14675 [Alkanindiges hydrocarboniclasticus]|uniref:Uncharacterized protein n=1 Tax=Alkanindiges hydrocarboniclasticus TaxID=1907941 RepID=A0A1S8CQY0_9GAMM|nr:hypothetical protein [Alkanindiges hydrocarboniclasticus]ONG37373.1 hypothetical protein BKE30_14675 [Alkanindiges hydrocarboniclasticus]
MSNNPSENSQVPTTVEVVESTTVEHKTEFNAFHAQGQKSSLPPTWVIILTGLLIIYLCVSRLDLLPPKFTLSGTKTIFIDVEKIVIANSAKMAQKASGEAQVHYEAQLFALKLKDELRKLRDQGYVVIQPQSALAWPASLDYTLRFAHDMNVDLSSYQKLFEQAPKSTLPANSVATAAATNPTTAAVTPVPTSDNAQTGDVQANANGEALDYGLVN